MLAIQIYFALLSLFVGEVPCRAFFSLEQQRLKNGAVIVDITADEKPGVELVSLFIKNGAALKFDRKTAFPAIAFRLLRYRLQRLAKAKGFLVTSEFNWDYSSFSFSLPKGSMDAYSFEIWAAIFDQNDVGPMELENIKREVLVSLREDLNRRSSKMSMMSLMSANNSVYSLGLYGNEDDLRSIDEKEFGDFLKSYLNPLGAVIVVSAVDKNVLKKISRELEKKRPVFKDDRSMHELAGRFDVPVRSISYVKANWKNVVLRMGFPSVKCSDKASFAYDLVQQLITDDKTFAGIGNSIYVSNNCYIGGGNIEIVISGLKDLDANDAVTLVLKRLAVLGKSLDDKGLKSTKENLIRDYSNALSRSNSLVFLTGKMGVLYSTPEMVLKYMDSIKAVKPSEVKQALSGLKENNSYVVIIRLEG